MAPEKGSLRAQSWIYGALNPLIDALRVEERLLGDGNLTWDWRLERPRVIRPPRDYLLGSGRTILEDLERAQRRSRHAAGDFDLRSHGWDIDEASRTASIAWRTLVGGDAFKTRVAEVLSETSEDALHDAAEHLVNNLRILDDRYPLSAIWSEKAPALFVQFEDSEVIRAHRAQVKQLLAATTKLIEALVNHRFALCEQYDIPAAPFAGLHSVP